MKYKITLTGGAYSFLEADNIVFALLTAAREIQRERIVKIEKAVPQISAFVLDDHGWAGWSNSEGEAQLVDIDDAVAQILRISQTSCQDIEWQIIDADNMKIYVSSGSVSDNAVKSAKVNFNVDITDVIIGFPAATPD